MRTEKYSTCVARVRFLNAVATHCPAVLAALRGDVLAEYAKLFIIPPAHEVKGYSTVYGVPPDFLEGPPERWLLRRVSKGDLPELLENQGLEGWSRDYVNTVDPTRITVRDRLEKWGRVHHLDESWIYETALDTMTWWLTRPSWPIMWRHNRGWRTEDVPPVLLISEQWRFEPWVNFSSRIESQIQEYKRSVNAYHAAIGYDPHGVGNSTHHFDWLALFQVKRQSPDKIRAWHEQTRGEQLAESAITKGYTRLAQRIGLRLRTKYLRWPD